MLKVRCITKPSHTSCPYHVHLCLTFELLELVEMLESGSKLQVNSVFGQSSTFTPLSVQSKELGELWKCQS